MSYATKIWVMIVLLLGVVSAWVAAIMQTVPAQSDAPERKPEPEPSRIISQYEINDFGVIEFRDSAGRVCVFMATGYSGVLDCGHVLLPLDYEQLDGLEKRPL